MRISIAIILYFLAFPLSAYAVNGVILKCRVDSPRWKSVFQLDAIGVGFLKFKKANEANSYTCGLKLEYIRDGLRAVVSNITVDFSRGSCDPELPKDLEKVLLKDYSIIVNLSSSRNPTGLVHWLKSEQPGDCIVEKINIPDIQMNAKKWLEGKWGRKTASDPKNHPKE